MEVANSLEINSEQKSLPNSEQYSMSSLSYDTVSERVASEGAISSERTDSVAT